MRELRLLLNAFRLPLLLMSAAGFAAGNAAMAADPPMGLLYDADLIDVGQLQNPSEILAVFPKDGQQKPDWVAMLKGGLITPRETASGSPRRPEVWGEAPVQVVVFANTREMPHVVFPHQPHIQWLACENCHDALFERKATGRGVGMEAILTGRHCGACHGRVAFSPEGSCYRCHTLPHPNSLAPSSLPGSALAVPSPPEVPDEGQPRRRRRDSARGSAGAAPVFPGKVE